MGFREKHSIKRQIKRFTPFFRYSNLEQLVISVKPHLLYSSHWLFIRLCCRNFRPFPYPPTGARKGMRSIGLAMDILKLLETIAVFAVFVGKHVYFLHEIIYIIVIKVNICQEGLRTQSN